MLSPRRGFALTLLAGCLSLGVLASSSVFAQEAEEELAAGEPIVAEVLEFNADEAPPVEVVLEPTPVPTAQPQSQPTVAPAPASAGNKLEMSVIDNRFQPTALTIPAGTTVTWTNNGNNIHTLTSPDAGFESGGLMGGASFSFTFDTAGTYRMICRQHALNGMYSQIVVL